MGDEACWDQVFSFGLCCIPAGMNYTTSAVNVSDATSKVWRSVNCRANRSTRGAWELFKDHRGNVTDMVAKALGPCHEQIESFCRLAILGAGNVNDVDLSRLVGRLGRIEVTAVDWDAGAMRGAVRRQRHPGLVWRTAVRDLVGLRPLGGLEPLLRHVLSHEVDVGSAFDTVLSACVLSQLCRHGNLLVLEARAFGALCAAIAEAHLHTMMRLLRPGGTGLLVSEVCDQNSCPACLSQPTRACLLAARDHLLFDAPALPTLLRSPGFPVELGSVREHGPWVWRLRAQGSFVVVAVSFRRVRLAGERDRRDQVEQYAKGAPISHHR